MGLTWSGRKKRSEELLRQKNSDDRKNRPVLTGYKPLKREEPSIRETVHMENTRGILALGGDEKKRLTLLVTEKHHPNGNAVAERERTLTEKGKREYPSGDNRMFVNPGERERGAIGFQLHPALTRTQVMDQVRHYKDSHDQKVLNRMMSFMITEEEIKYKQKLEEVLQEKRRDKQDASTRILEKLLHEKKEELVQKRQTEAYFGQKLEKAIQEEKQTVWKNQKQTETMMQNMFSWREEKEDMDTLLEDEDGRNNA